MFDGEYLYIADSNNNRIDKYDSDGSLSLQWGTYGTGDGQVNCPRDLAVDPDGDIFVLDSGNHRVQKFTNTGTFLGWFGKGNVTTGWHAPGSGETPSSGNGNGEFNAPKGIAITLDRYIYVSDSDNNRIQKFNSTGVYQTPPGPSEMAILASRAPPRTSTQMPRSSAAGTHKMVNVLDKLPKNVQLKAKQDLQDMASAETQQQAEARRDNFVRWCREADCQSAAETLVRDWESDGNLLRVSTRALEASPDN